MPEWSKTPASSVTEIIGDKSLTSLLLRLTAQGLDVTVDFPRISTVLSTKQRDQSFSILFLIWESLSCSLCYSAGLKQSLWRDVLSDRTLTLQSRVILAARSFSLPGQNSLWPTFYFLALPSAIILPCIHIICALWSSASCLNTLFAREPCRALFVSYIPTPTALFFVSIFIWEEKVT
jgi:hypothetical protein